MSDGSSHSPTTAKSTITAELMDELNRAGRSAPVPHRSRAAACCQVGDGCRSITLRGMFGLCHLATANACSQRVTAFGHQAFLLRGRSRASIYFASEIKALLPVLPDIVTDSDALAEYLTFQYTIGDRNLFKHVHALLPGHALVVENGSVRTFRYWSADGEIDRDHDPAWFVERMNEILDDSIAMHLRSDVPVGAYVSGGFDSSLIAVLASGQPASSRIAFHGKFTDHPGYDESSYAEIVADEAALRLHQRTITSQDFCDSIEKVIYHLDHPVAGPEPFRNMS